MAKETSLDLQSAIGGCGKFQVFLTIATNSANMACVWGIMFMTFGNFNPGWRCEDEDFDNSTYHSNPTDNISYNIYETTTLAPANKSSHYVTQWTEECDVKRKCRNLIHNTASSTVVTEWNLTCGMDWVSSVIFSVGMVGGLLGCYVSGQIGDKFGRKVSLYAHLFLQVISHVVSAFSSSWQMYVIANFFTGFGAGGVLANSYAFTLEFASGWYRAIIVSIPDWNFGFVAFTLVAYLLRNWQQMHLLAAGLAFVVFLTVFWVPESVRWLTVSGKPEKAKQVVGKIARFNGRSIPNTNAIDDISFAEKVRMGGHTYTYIDLFKMPSLRWNTVKFGIIWATMSWVYYGVSLGIRSLSGDFFLNLVMSSVLEIPAVLLVAPTTNILGRRKAALLYFFIEVTCCFTLVTMSFATTGHVKEMSILVLALLSRTVISGAWGIIIVLGSEIFPTPVRACAFGFLNATSRLASILAPYILPHDPDTFHFSFIVIGAIGLVCCGLIWSMPETSGRELKDTTKEITQNDVLEMKQLQKDTV